jgi:hypothetical protein
VLYVSPLAAGRQSPATNMFGVALAVIDSPQTSLTRKDN